MTDVLLLRAADRTVRPWLNGGGTTQDVALFPHGAGLADFGWRLSIAEVAQAGPFSIFPGVDRHLAILAGRMALAIGSEPERDPLTATDDPVCFAGDIPTTGTPVGGPVTDLNLMIRRDAFAGRLIAADALELVTTSETTLVIARAVMTATVQTRLMALAPLDALLMPRGTAVRATGPLLLAAIDPICNVEQA